MAVDIRMIEEWIRFIKSEWLTIVEHPVLFAGSMVTAFTTAFAIVVWYFKKQINDRKSQMTLLEERLRNRDEEIKSLGKKIAQLSEKEVSVARPPEVDFSTAPQPEFGCPLQLSLDPPLSWWHIPVWLKIISGSPSVSYEHCTAALIFLERSPFPDRSVLNLRCQSDQGAGSKEFSLRPGEEPKQLPIVQRIELAPANSAFPVYFTDEAHLLHGVMQKVKPGTHRFRLKIRYETKTWESGVYSVRIPEGQVSNGQFVVSKEPHDL